MFTFTVGRSGRPWRRQSHEGDGMCNMTSFYNRRQRAKRGIRVNHYYCTALLLKSAADYGNYAAEFSESAVLLENSALNFFEVWTNKKSGAVSRQDHSDSFI